MKSQINILQLVYPPISNQEAEWLKDDHEVKKILKSSNLYMVCQKPEAFFTYNTNTECKNTIRNDGKFIFSLVTQNHNTLGEIDLSQLIKLNNVDLEQNAIEIEIGSKLFRFWKVEKTTDKKNVIAWFTPEKILFDKSHGHPAISGLIDYKKFTQYFLHYVGISKKENSLSRLITNPHEKRLRILSNEKIINYGSRLTDEIIHLFFTVNPVRITQVKTDEELSELANGVKINLTQIVADAEKAYVKFLNSEYNTVKYDAYPKGADGLYNTGLSSYCYLIGEDISLFTKTAIIDGRYISDDVGFPSTQDCIFINGDEVTFIKTKNQT